MTIRYSRRAPVGAALLALGTLTPSVLAQDGCRQPTQLAFPRLAIPAGNITIVYTNIPGQPNNVVPGLGGQFEFSATLTSKFNRPRESSNGAFWAIECDADTGSTTSDEILIVNGALFLQEGTQAPWAPLGETVGTIDEVFGLNANGDMLIANGTGGTAVTTSNDYVAMYTALGGTWSVIAQETQLVDAVMPALAGATWDDTMDGPYLANTGAFTFRATGLDGNPPITGTTVDSALVNPFTPGGAAWEGMTAPAGQAGGATDTWQNFDINLGIVSPDGLSVLIQGDTNAAAGDDILTLNDFVVLQETQVIPGGPSLEVIDTAGIVQSWIDNGGNWYSRGEYAPSQGDFVVRNGVVVAQSDVLDPITPGSSEHWDDTDFAACFFAFDGNTSGAYVICGVTDAPSTNNGVVVLDDGLGNRTVVVRENDPVDLDGNGAYDDNAFISTFGNDDVLLLENGDVMFTATMRNGANASIGTGLFLVTPGKATCAVRNGSGINPVDLECTTAPVIGGLWTLDTNPNGGTILTFLVLAFDPAPVPFPFLGGEVLVDVTNPSVETYTGPGVFNFNVPPVPSYTGFPLFMQGARVDGGGSTFVVLNAIDAVLGN